MMPRSTIRLPKAHLHLHLDGSARAETLNEMARRQGLPATEFGACTDWSSFVAESIAFYSSIGSLDDLARICRELVEDEAAQGVAYTEPMIVPHVLGMKLGDAEEVFAVIRDSCAEAARRAGIHVGFMLGAIRDLPPELAAEHATFAAEHAADGVVAFGLAGDEAAHPPDAFVRAFAIAREAGLLCVPHAGEGAGAASVAAALDRLRPDRIAHGVRAVEDPRVLRRLAEARIPCDVCPTSNVRLGVVRDMGAHPLPRLLEAGVPLTINADDPTSFGSGVADEYERVRAAFGLDDGSLAGIARTSAAASGAPAAVKDEILAGIDAWLAKEEEA
jgi:adenosine deaminase